MDFKDYYATLGVAKTATRQGDQAGVPEAGAQASTRTSTRATRRPRPGSRRSTRPTRFSATRTSGRSTTSSARTGGMYEQAGAGGARRRGQSGGAWNVTRRRARRRLPHDDPKKRCGTMFGESDPFSDFFHTFFGGAAGRGGRRARRGRAGGPRRASGPRRRAGDRARPSRTPIHGTMRRLAITHNGAARTVDVRIPAGVGDGSRVRVAGEGERGGGRRAERATCYLRIRLAAAPDASSARARTSTRKSAIPLTTAVLGGEARGAHARGKALRLKIPPTTQNGQVFRLKGHGMPTCRQAGRAPATCM